MKRLALFSLTMLFVFVCGHQALAQNESQTTGSELIGGDFKLTNHHGKSVSQKDFNGKYMLVFFGFTRCNTVCPIGLSAMSKSIQRLPESMREQVRPVFVTVDPEGDTLEVMKNYLSHFGKNFIGLTGSQEEIDNMINNYRGYYAKIPDGKKYSYDHSDIIYFMDKSGDYISHFSSSTGPEAISKKILERLEKEEKT